MNPIITKDQFTEEEARTIFTAHKESGNKWVDIAKLMPGRYFELIAFKSALTNHANPSLGQITKSRISSTVN